jgi:hypothetical protein
MRIRANILIFGIITGFLWAFVPGILSELLRSDIEISTVLVAGVVTGVLTSIVLSAPAEKSPPVVTLCLGLLALPLGAFLFGISISVTHLAPSLITGTTYRFVETGFHPLRTGFQYAFYSVFSVFALGLFPMAVFTTFLLRTSLRWRSSVNRGV